MSKIRSILEAAAARAAKGLPPPENAQKTQIAGTLPTYKKAQGLLGDEGPGLDYGAGLGLGAKEMGFDAFEPFPRAGFEPKYTDSGKIPSNSYARMTSLNVLNVLPPELRDQAVDEIGRILAPKGKAVVTTRGRDVMTAKGEDGPEPMSKITTAGTYQKGFTPKELEQYVADRLGQDRFDVKQLKLGPAGVEIYKKYGIAGVIAGGAAMFADPEDAEAGWVKNLAQDVERKVLDLGRKELPKVSWDSQAGKMLYKMTGDRTDAGRRLLEIDGEELRSPTDLHGGPFFGAQEGVDDEFWASHQSNILPIANTIIKARERGETPLYGYTSMGTPSSDFAHMTADTYAGLLNPSKVDAGFARMLDEKIRAKIGPKWPGLLSDDLIKGFGKLPPPARKTVLGMLDNAGPTNAKLPNMRKVRGGIRDPETVNSGWNDTGLMLAEPGEGDRASDLMVPQRFHRSYNTGLKGTLLGVGDPLPPEIAFRDHMIKTLMENPDSGWKTDNAITKALMGNPTISQKIDDEFLDRANRYTQELTKRGGLGTSEGQAYRNTARTAERRRLEARAQALRLLRGEQ